METNHTLGLAPVCVGKGERQVSKGDSKMENRGRTLEKN